jgi:hypothetical protein
VCTAGLCFLSLMHWQDTCCFRQKKKLCSVLHELNPFLFEQPLVD